MPEQLFYCAECGEPCTPVEETFDYAGSHCTYGRSGTHRTGYWVSDCCLADLQPDPKEDDDADC